MEIIDFDIETLKNEIVVENSGVYIPTDGIAKETDAFLVLEWTETRNLLLNDLTKVGKYFLLNLIQIVFKANYFPETKIE